MGCKQKSYDNFVSQSTINKNPLAILFRKETLEILVEFPGKPKQLSVTEMEL